jgi:GNAT superfamily N-acetyltransferase
VEIRPITAADDLIAITDMVHSAYAPHARSGLRFWGTHQTVEDTARRLGTGSALVMRVDGRYIGIVIVRPPQPASEVPLYREPTVWSISQFCVAPECQGMGYGRKLHEGALCLASEAGAEFLALDTAEPGKGLIAMYERWGYAVVGTCDWRPHTNYRSVLMKRVVSNGDAAGPQSDVRADCSAGAGAARRST